MGYPKKVDFSLVLKCFLGTSWGPNGDQVGPSGDQVGTKWDQVGAKWDQVEGQVGPSADQVGAKWGPSADQVGPGGPSGTRRTKWDQVDQVGRWGTPKKLFFHWFLKVFWRKKKQNDRNARRLSARLAGTPCDSLKSLLEPYSVPLLGNLKK